MRLLVVMTQFPFPPRSGSSIIAVNQITELARRHEVCLVCPAGTVVSAVQAAFGGRFEAVDPPRNSRLLILARAGCLMLFGVPASVGVQWSRALRDRVASMLGDRRWDAVLLYELAAIQFVPRAFAGRTIANVEDAQSIKLCRSRGLDVWNWWERAKLAVHEWVTRRYERRVLPRLGKVLLLSEADVSDMSAAGGHQNLGCVPYGVSAAPVSERPAFGARDPGMVVVTGNMFHPPNVDGVLHFLSTSFGRVLRDEPSARLWLVGADPDPRIRAKAAEFRERVVVTGRVDNVFDYLRRARVSVCPVRLAIGVQTKVLEALAWGTPVVTTSAGNAGIRGRSGEDLWVEDDPAMVAARVVELLRGVRWAEMSASGARLVEERHTWSLSAERLEEHIHMLS